MSTEPALVPEPDQRRRAATTTITAGSCGIAQPWSQFGHVLKIHAAVDPGVKVGGMKNRRHRRS
jgi:hypothetical protein